MATIVIVNIILTVIDAIIINVATPMLSMGSGASSWVNRKSFCALSSNAAARCSRRTSTR